MIAKTATSGMKKNGECMLGFHARVSKSLEEVSMTYSYLHCVNRSMHAQPNRAA